MDLHFLQPPARCRQGKGGGPAAVEDVDGGGCGSRASRARGVSLMAERQVSPTRSRSYMVWLYVRHRRQTRTEHFRTPMSLSLFAILHLCEGEGPFLDI